MEEEALGLGVMSWKRRERSLVEAGRGWTAIPEKMLVSSEEAAEAEDLDWEEFEVPDISRFIKGASGDEMKEKGLTTLRTRDGWRLVKENT